MVFIYSQIWINFLFDIYLFQAKQIMKSPTLRSQYTYGLNLSAVYESRKAGNANSSLQVNNVQNSNKQLSNKSSAMNKDISNKQFCSLRTTIGSPEGITNSKSSTRMVTNTRKTSYEGAKSFKSEHTGTIYDTNEGHDDYRRSKISSYSMKETAPKEPYRTFESTGTNYNKIMQKLDKKQKLIQQLKKLTEVKILDKGKNTYDLKTNNKDKNQGANQIKTYGHSNVLKVDSFYPLHNDRINGLSAYRIVFDCNSPMYLNSSSSCTGKEGKEKEKEKEKDKGLGLRYLKQKIINKMTMTSKEYNDTSYKIQIKNPEEEKKSKMSYYSPKVNKDKEQPKPQTRYTPKTNISRQAPLNLSDYKIYEKNIISSPASLKIAQSTVKQVKQVKTMKEIKQIASFSHRKTSFSLKEKKLSINDFMIGKSLGQGKFGVVYQALHRQTNCLVALKKISKVSIKSNYMIDQFLLEVKIQSFCEHENILKLYGFFDDKDHIYLVLQYMEQGTLFQQLKRTKTFSEEQASKKLKHVAQAIKYLHQNGIAHRDIKPQNIVISHGVGKLCDFGWAAICNQRRKTYCGTFDYAAPQILEGVQYDMTVDLWCLGVLAYELMVGKAPFYHISRKQTMKKILNVQQTAIQFPPTMTKNAISFIQNLIRKNPSERMTAENVLKHPFLFQRQ